MTQGPLTTNQDLDSARLREAFVAFRASLAERGVRATVSGMGEL